MKLRSDGWYKSDEGKHFVLTEKGQNEVASFKNKEIGSPVSKYDTEAVQWSVDKGYEIEVPIPNWIEKEGFKVVYNHNGYELFAGNPIVFPERWIAEKYMENYKRYSWVTSDLYIATAIFKGINPSKPVYHNGKQVYDDSWYYGVDALTIGDLVTEDVAMSVVECVPPACFRSDCSQCGEPASHKIDEDGKVKETYTTFKNIADDIWEYCGECFKGKNVESGKEISCI